MRAEIYQAEANTEAAQGRQNRLIAYGALALTLLLAGVGNVALTTMKQVGVDVNEQGYGWTEYIPLLSTTWGGYVDIIMAGLFGTMVELENRTKDEVAEKIWEEMQRRAEERDLKGKKSPKKRKKKGKNSRRYNPLDDSSDVKDERVRVTKQSKRLRALEEVIFDNDKTPSQLDEKLEESTSMTTGEKVSTIEEKPKEDSGGIWGKLKGFYQEADQIAASQALILNKNLEDRGILEKITDESGLKVVRKEEAVKQFKKDKKKEQG